LFKNFGWAAGRTSQEKEVGSVTGFRSVILPIGCVPWKLVFEKVDPKGWGKLGSKYWRLMGKRKLGGVLLRFALTRIVICLIRRHSGGRNEDHREEACPAKRQIKNWGAPPPHQNIRKWDNVKEDESSMYRAPRTESHREVPTPKKTTSRRKRNL